MLNKTINFRAKLFVKAFLLLAFVGFAPHVSRAQQPPAPKPCFDFTGSGRTSFATVSRSSTANVWRILANPTGSLQTVTYGFSEQDNLTPGYFDNDNRADINVYRRFEGRYYLRPSTAPNTIQGVTFGFPTDVSGREADYDGDGRDDFTVIRDGGNALVWFFLRSSNNTLGVINFGLPGFTTGTGNGDYPIAGADYNGDGRAEITVIRSTATGAATYLAGDSNTGQLVTAQQWGNFDTDFFVVGDYLGDRRADFAVFRAFQGGTNGDWFIRENGGTATVIRRFGFSSLAGVTDRPICGDYNGDGKQDIAIYRSSNSSFYWLNSPDFNAFSGLQFGQPGDFPVAGLRSF